MVETAMIKAGFLIFAALGFMAFNSGSLARFYKNYKKIVGKAVNKNMVDH